MFQFILFQSFTMIHMFITTIFQLRHYRSTESNTDLINGLLKQPKWKQKTILKLFSFLARKFHLLFFPLELSRVLATIRPNKMLETQMQVAKFESTPDLLLPESPALLQNCNLEPLLLGNRLESRNKEV